MMAMSARSIGLGTAMVVIAGCGGQTPAAGEPFPAQSLWVNPPRPPLAADADTNDPNAYYQLGALDIVRRPDTAAAAFYWTTRLDPWRADAHYARSVALIRSLWKRHRQTGMWMPTRRLRENEMKVIDSLNRIAYELDPYIDRRFDRLVGPPATPYLCERARDAVSAGLCFMQLGNFAASVQKLGAALEKDPKLISLHYLRAQAHFQLGQYDSAAAELGVLADSLGNRQEKELTAFYVSRATIYYAQGMAYMQMADTVAARSAYERALVEDLGFHMASVRLAGRALSVGDTTEALSQLAHAVGVSPSDAPLRYYYGLVLDHNRQYKEAEEQYRKAIEINEDFAPPYLHLARLLEPHDLASAVASYDTFLMRSPRSDTTRAWVAQRLRRLVGSP
ncbi:MAG TPA: tetratricopeptide repeat protein [Gemmatimonadaceae bacterium]|nr:tetratricopeptide repeat protein [Gemmatimonadaceae bacterium]